MVLRSGARWPCICAVARPASYLRASRSNCCRFRQLQAGREGGLRCTAVAFTARPQAAGCDEAATCADTNGATRVAATRLGAGFNKVTRCDRWWGAATVLASALPLAVGLTVHAWKPRALKHRRCSSLCGAEVCCFQVKYFLGLSGFRIDRAFNIRTVINTRK